MEEKLEKQEDVTICENCNYIYKPVEIENDRDCPKCGEYSKKYGTKITTSKIFIKE